MIMAWKLEHEVTEQLAPEFAAEFLASHGGLAPIALTEDDAVKIGADASSGVPASSAELAHCVREGLERIAKGL